MLVSLAVLVDVSVVDCIVVVVVGCTDKVAVVFDIAVEVTAVVELDELADVGTTLVCVALLLVIVLEPVVLD